MVSIIIPVYNGAKTLTHAISSATNQTYRNIEIILVNDGSTDESSLICDEFAKKDSRVKAIHKANGGSASARNAGLSAASGDYIQFIDCDDTLDVNAIEILCNNIESNDFVLFGFNVYQGEKLLRTPNPGIGVCVIDSINEFKRINKLFDSVCNKFYKREYIKKLFQSDLVYGEDLIFNLENIEYGSKIKLLDNCFYNVQLGTNDSVNKRYKEGKINNFLRTRKIKEDKLLSLFPDTFNVYEFRKNEKSSLAMMIVQCGYKLTFNDFKKELCLNLNNKYFRILILNNGGGKFRVKTIFFLTRFKFFLLLRFFIKILYK